MQSWFNTPERIAALEAAAQSWVGTPFVANSRVKGPRGGVSCQMLAEQLYIESGFPVPFRVPSGSMRWCETHRDSLIEQFIDSQSTIFKSFKNMGAGSACPGDIIGFRIRGCVHHVGVTLERGRFIHAMRGLGTKIFNLNDPTYAERIAKIWRASP